MLKHQYEVKFSIKFEFKSVILDAVIGTFFSMATNKMIKAFETRAYHISNFFSTRARKVVLESKIFD